MSSHNPAVVPGKKGKRIFKRLPCQIPIRIDGEFQTWTGFCYDISAQGLSLEISGIFMSDHEYEVHLVPDPDTTATVMVNERFRRTDPDGVKLGVRISDQGSTFTNLYERLEQKVLKESFDPGRTDFTQPFWLRDQNDAHQNDSPDFFSQEPLAGSMRRVGDFQIIQKLGSGMIGTSFKVRNDADEVLVLKVIHPHYLKRVGAADAWMGYLKKVRDLHHDFVAPIHEVGLLPDKKNVFYTMPFYQGGSIGFHAQKMHTAGTVLHHSYVLRWMDQLARGLAFLHDRGIAHCNLKPENLFLNARGEIELCDLALPYQFLDPRGRDYVLAQSPPAFISPQVREALASEGPIPRPYACDIYGFAGLLEFLLTAVRYGSKDRPLGDFVMGDRVVQFLSACRQNPPKRMPKADALLPVFRKAFAEMSEKADPDVVDAGPAQMNLESAPSFEPDFNELPLATNESLPLALVETAQPAPELDQSLFQSPAESDDPQMFSSQGDDQPLALALDNGVRPEPAADESGIVSTFKRELRQAWAQGAISREDRNRLATLRKELGIPPHEALHLEEEVMFEPEIKAVRDQVRKNRRDSRQGAELAPDQSTVPAEQAPQQKQGSFNWLLDGLMFPFRGVLPLLLSTLPFIAVLPVFGLLTVGVASTFVVACACLGLAFAWTQRVIVEGAEGRQQPPGMPPIANITQDVFRPYVHMALVFIFACLPPILVMSIGGPSEDQLVQDAVPADTEEPGVSQSYSGYGVTEEDSEPEAAPPFYGDVPGIAPWLEPVMNTIWFWAALLMWCLLAPPLMLGAAFSQEFENLDPRIWAPALQEQLRPYLTVLSVITGLTVVGGLGLYMSVSWLKDFGLILFAPLGAFIGLVQLRLLGTFKHRCPLSF